MNSAIRTCRAWRGRNLCGEDQEKAPCWTFPAPLSSMDPVLSLRLIASEMGTTVNYQHQSPRLSFQIHLLYRIDAHESVIVATVLQSLSSTPYDAGHVLLCWFASIGTRRVRKDAPKQHKAARRARRDKEIVWIMISRELVPDRSVINTSGM